MEVNAYQEVVLPSRMEDVNLEGPFLSLEEFLHAEQIKDALKAQQKKDRAREKHNQKRKGSKQSKGARTFEGSVDYQAEGETFILTTTGNEESYGESSNDELPSGSMSRNSIASTATGTMHRPDSRTATKRVVNTRNKGIQCRRRIEKKEEDVDTVLRRYFFSLEWDSGSLGPGLLATAKAAGHAYLPSAGQSLQPSQNTTDAATVGAHDDESLRITSEADRVVDRPKSAAPQVIKELSATRSLAARPPRAAYANSAHGGGKDTPNIEMCFYEVKLPPDEAQPHIDYTVDYRRYSYTDFKIKTDSGGQSTIPPETLTKWIEKAVPRNQDDVYPLFVLCRDLLRKFHQKEIRYSIKKEDDMEEEIRGLHETVLEERALHARTVETALAERAAWEAERAEMGAKMEEMQQRLKDFDALEAELNDMKEQYDPSIFEELRQLEAEMGVLSTEHRELKGQHGALLTLKEVMRAREIVYKKAQERLGKDLEEALAGKEDAELRYQAERAKLTEKTKEHDALRAKTPFEHVEGWNAETKLMLFKTFLSAEDLVQQLKIDDIAMIPPRSKHDLARMLMRLIKDQCESAQSSWVEAMSSALGTEPQDLYYTVYDAIKAEDEYHMKLIQSMDISQSSPVWEMVRGAMDAAGVQMDNLAGLELMTGVDKDVLFTNITGLQKEQAELMTQNFDLFKKWFDRFGNNPSGLDDAAVEAMRETEKRRKYGLFEEQTHNAVPFSEKETLRHIGCIFDHKVETDYRNEKDQKPRANMVKTVRSYMLKICPKKREADDNLERFCTSVVKYKDTNVRIRTFGILSGLTDTHHWTERSVCFLFCFFQELKSKSSPGNESKNPADLGVDWDIYRTWLGTGDFAVESDLVIEAAKIAADSKFGFGTLNNLTRALTGAEIEREGFGDPLSFDMATAILLDRWFEQFDTAKAALRVLFETFDVDGDEVLELAEFIELVKSTPMKIRQHDAINMFHELAGPDDTMDQAEFAELLTFYKFNTRTLLTTMEATQRKLARRTSSDMESRPMSPETPD